VTQFVPYRRTIADLFTLDYSRDMERQADTLGTQLIALKATLLMATQLNGHA